MIRNFKRYLLTAALLLPVNAALAEDAPTYPLDVITGHTLAGLSLGMTQDEAEAVLTEAGYEGEFPSEIEGRYDSLKPWRTIDNGVFVERFIDTDGSAKIWRIQFVQMFDVEQSQSVLEGKLFERFGQPSDVDRGNGGILTWHSERQVKHSTADICDLQGDNGMFCWRTAATGSGLDPEQYEILYRAEKLAPTLWANVRDKEMRIELSDRGMKERALEFAKLAEEQRVEAERAAASGQVELDF